MTRNCRTDSEGRNVIEMWSDKVSKSRAQSTILSIVAVVIIGNLLYGAVFAPHLVTKLGGCDVGTDGAAVPRGTEPTPLTQRFSGCIRQA